MRTELQRRRRPLTWVAPAGEAEEVSASRAPHVRHSALHPAAWHGRPTAADQDPRAKGQAEEWPVLPRPADSGSAFQGCLPSLQAPSGDTAGRGRNRWDPKQKSPTPRWGRDAAKASEGERGSEHNVISPASETDKPSTAPSAEASRSPSGPSAEARALSRAAAGPDPGRRRGPGRRAHAPHRPGRGQRHNVSSWCVQKMTPEKVSRGRARDRESGAGPSSRERTRRPPWRREPGPDRSPAAWGPRFPPSPQLRRSLSVGPWPCRSLDERREAG